VLPVVNVTSAALVAATSMVEAGVSERRAGPAEKYLRGIPRMPPLTSLSR
jgi:hypothetical protein